MKKYKWFIIGFIICLTIFIGVPLAAVRAFPSTPCPNIAFLGDYLDKFLPSRLANGLSKAIFSFQAWAGPKPCGGGGGGSQPPPGCTMPPLTDCQDYKLSGQQWSQPASVEYYFDTSEVPSYLNLSDVQTAIDNAFAEWDQYSGGIQFIRKGVCNGCAHNLNDGKNGIGFDDFPPEDALGKTFTRPLTGNLVEVDTLLDFNPSHPGWEYNWTVGIPNPCDSLYDVQNVLTHEFGHWLKLLDLYNNYDAVLTMYGDLSTDVCKDLRRTLGAGDIKGIQAIYGL